MPDAHDVSSFELDYCQVDVSKIARAIKAKASLLVIGMPGCGKSRLIDFLLHKHGVLEKYGLSNSYKFITVDGDTLTQPHDMYIRLLRALNPQIKAHPEGGIATIKDYLLDEVESLEVDIDLVVIFDNFNQRLQQALSEDFLNFLYGLRNKRRKLNISYIFMANLKIDLTSFHKVDRLFDKGVDHSICWLSLLNRQDVAFSIERQWRREGDLADKLDEDEREKIKKRIYQLGGGHALLGRYLAHLMLSGEVTVASELQEILTYHGIRSTCEAIWNDLAQNHKNLLIDLAKSSSSPMTAEKTLLELLKNYRLLAERNRFFSPLFENFVKTQEKTGVVTGAHCDETRTRVIIKTIDGYEIPLALSGLSQRKRSLLCYLLTNHGETCSKDQLIKIGWPSDREGGVSEQALSRQMDGLKKWLNEQAQLSQYVAIETQWGEGYKLVIKG